MDFPFLSASSASSPILVTIFLRGGCDGLNLVGPANDPDYIALRRAETRVEATGATPGLVLKQHFADADFRLHYKAGKLKELYDAGQLALVHACGLTDGTRSHFEAQDYIERGTPGDRRTSTGWLTRLAGGRALPGMVPIVSTNNTLPVSLLACPQAVAVPSVRRVQLPGDARYASVLEGLLKTRYAGDDLLHRNGLKTLVLADWFAQASPAGNGGKNGDYVSAAGVNYPGEGYATELANGLKTLAQLIKMESGVRLATVDYGGWDTHVDQGGRFANLTDGLSRSLGAFWDDMKAYQDRLTVVVMSEFGRRLKGNESRGTDHGHGNMMLVLGGKIRGGELYGKWPGLHNDALDNHVDLAVTTDYRQVLWEATRAGWPDVQPGQLFPGFTPAAKLGLVG